VTQPPSPYSSQGSDEQIWARPSADGGRGAPVPPTVPYTGPPKAPPAPPGWKPPTLIQVPAAHTLPEQDDTALDQQERAARTITNGVGMIAGAIALLVLIVVCGRVLF
jgi:beta-lactam-binding protein with PASTA domain